MTTQPEDGMDIVARDHIFHRHPCVDPRVGASFPGRAALHHGKRKICFDNCADAMFLLTAPAVTAAVFVILTADLVQEVTLLFMTLFSKCIVANATAL